MCQEHSDSSLTSTQVLEKCTELLSAVPGGFTEASYLEDIAAQGGLGVPLNIFLMQVMTMKFT